jgi:hypothetical protein
VGFVFLNAFKKEGGHEKAPAAQETGKFILPRMDEHGFSF